MQEVKKMIQIDPNTLYSRQDLTDLLDDSGVDVDTFIARIKARKVFRLLWLGSDILAALRDAPALSERSTQSLPTAKNCGNRRKRNKASGDFIDPLQKIINGIAK